MQLPQARRVGRADVDRQIVRNDAHCPDARNIIGDPVRAVLVGADVDADNAATRTAFEQALVRGGMAMVVEAQAVDHRAILAQPEQPRLVVPGLRLRGDRADLDEAEAEAQHLPGDLGILVEPGGEADRRRKVDSGHPRPERLGQIRRPVRRHPPQRRDRRAMRGFRVKREGQRAEERVEVHAPRLSLRAQRSNPGEGSDSHEDTKDTKALALLLRAFVPLRETNSWIAASLSLLAMTTGG